MLGCQHTLYIKFHDQIYSNDVYFCTILSNQKYSLRKNKRICNKRNLDRLGELFVRVENALLSARHLSRVILDLSIMT